MDNNTPVSDAPTNDRKCPRCWKRPVEVPDAGLCWPCNSFLMDREEAEEAPGFQRDWRIGKRVAVKYRTDPRFGMHGAVALADGDSLTVRLDDGSLVTDHQDNWRTA